jgi:hypothetical protein
MSKIFLVYLVIPILMVILWFVSKGAELPPGINETGISRAFLQISLFIYDHIKKRIRTMTGEKIRMYLGTLEQRRDLDNAETEYFIRKISIVLLMATAGSILAMLMSYSAQSSTVVSKEGVIERNAFGERDFDAHLVATDDSGDELLEYTLPVRTRMFTQEETKELFDEASSGIEDLILGENVSLDEVTTDLDLVDRIKGYPFDISWKLDNYEIMHFDGGLIEEMIPEEGEVVTLTAVYSYEDMKFEQILHAYVIPRPLTLEERIERDIKRLLEKADEESLQRHQIILPDSYEGEPVIWSEKITDNSAMLLLLALIGAAASFVLKDKELKKEMEVRRFQMLYDYPQFVSHLVLYMGAGMTVRNIMQKLTTSYSKEKEKGGKKSFLYEEILRGNREIAAGTSEAVVYEHIGIRCGMQQYTRLFTLLSQNLKKGNSELLSLLQEESKKAFEERMDKVRKAGEEAGTKLLLPMVIMLVIVMVIIMIPAYMAF